MTSTSAQQEVNRFSELIHSQSMFDINVGEFAEIKEFHKTTMTADIIPLIDDVGGDDESVQINECQVLLPCLLDFIDTDPNWPHKPYYRELKKGDKVFVVFSNRNLDNFDGKKKYTKSNERMHSINDAVIVGRYKLP